MPDEKFKLFKINLFKFDGSVIVLARTKMEAEYLYSHGIEAKYDEPDEMFIESNPSEADEVMDLDDVDEPDDARELVDKQVEMMRSSALFKNDYEVFRLLEEKLKVMGKNKQLEEEQT